MSEADDFQQIIAGMQSIYFRFALDEAEMVIAPGNQSEFADLVSEGCVLMDKVFGRDNRHTVELKDHHRAGLRSNPFSLSQRSVGHCLGTVRAASDACRAGLKE